METKQIKLSQEQEEKYKQLETETRTEIKTAYDNLVNIIKRLPLNKNGLHWANAITRLDEFSLWIQTCPLDGQSVADHLGIDVNAPEEAERQADEVADHGTPAE